VVRRRSACLLPSNQQVTIFESDHRCTSFLNNHAAVHTGKYTWPLREESFSNVVFPVLYTRPRNRADFRCGRRHQVHGTLGVETLESKEGKHTRPRTHVPDGSLQKAYTRINSAGFVLFSSLFKGQARRGITVHQTSRCNEKHFPMLSGIYPLGLHTPVECSFGKGVQVYQVITQNPSTRVN
jgi:hypothetical protein